MVKAIEVTATANGYYGGIVRRPGDRFVISDDEAFSEAWMTKDKPDGVATRRVNLGGTDGVVGGEVPKKGVKLSKKDKIEAAQELTGRSDITTVEEANAILASAQGLSSDNDDRERDMAIDRSQDAPLPDEAGEENEI